MNKYRIVKVLPHIIWISIVLVFVGFLFIHFTNLKSPKLTTTATLEPVSSQVNYLTQFQKYEIEAEQIDSVPKDPEPITSLKNTGWIPDWDLSDGYDTLQKYSSELASVSPFWLMPQNDGHLKEVSDSVNAGITQFSSDNNIQLIPTITLIDADLFSSIFDNTDNYKTFMNDALNEVDNNNYAGLDLDFEDLKFTDKDIFFKMLTDLKAGLAQRNKVLVFTAISKWGDEVEYLGHPQTREVLDYKQIGAIVDEFRIMTYDFYGRDSADAGPIAPLDWMKRVLQYAIYEGIPRQKIVLGIPTYAYDWSDRPLAPNTIDLESDGMILGSLLGRETGDSYYHAAVDKVISQYDMQSTFNSTWGEAVGTYIYQGAKRIVVYPTDESIQLRKQLAADYGIKGVAFWKLGDEGSLKL